MIYGLILADILMAGLFAFKFSHFPQEIPFFYSRAWGEDQLADFWFILLLPALMHLFMFLNIYLYNKYFLPDHFIRRIIDILNWTLMCVFTAVFLRIIIFIT